MTATARPDAFASALDLLYPQPTEHQWATPGELARTLDPNTRQTPALDLIDKELAAVEAGESDRLIISMPPQEGKSERATHYGALWMLHRNPERRIGIVSYGEDIAGRMSYSIRNDIATFNGDEGTVDLGLRLRKDSKAASRWYLDGHRGGVYAIGIGGALTGRPIDALFIDDPVKDYRAADSSLLSEMAWQWWQSVARPRLAPGAPVVLVLTRWHEADLAGRMQTKQTEDEKSSLEHFDRWRVVNIAAQADRPDDPLGRKPGEFMASARGRTAAQWEATKAATSARIWSALYQGKPTPDSGDVFKRQWWRPYETPPWSEQPDGSFLVPDATMVLQSWDMTFKDKASSDFVVGQVWAQKGAEVFLVDQVRARLSFTDSLAAVRRMTARWPQAAVKLVEDKANGTAIIDSLKREISGIIPVTPHESKQARASAVAPFVEAGNVWVPTSEVALFDVGSFLEETSAFPNGAHDDQVDTMSQALARVYLSVGQGAAFLSAWKAQAEAAGKTGKAEAELAQARTVGAVKRKPKCKHRWGQFGCVLCGEPAAEADE